MQLAENAHAVATCPVDWELRLSRRIVSACRRARAVIAPVPSAEPSGAAAPIAAMGYPTSTVSRMIREGKAGTLGGVREADQRFA